MEVFLEVTVQHKKYHADFLVKADVTSEKELEKLERGVRKINGVCSVQPVYALQEII